MLFLLCFYFRMVNIQYNFILFLCNKSYSAVIIIKHKLSFIKLHKNIKNLCAYLVKVIIILCRIPMIAIRFVRSVMEYLLMWRIIQIICASRLKIKLNMYCLTKKNLNEKKKKMMVSKFLDVHSYK